MLSDRTTTAVVGIRAEHVGKVLYSYIFHLLLSYFESIVSMGLGGYMYLSSGNDLLVAECVFTARHKQHTIEHIKFEYEVTCDMC